MRKLFIDELIKEAKNNNKIFLLVGDLGYNVVEPFQNLFPDRFLNVGVAEQNLAGIASGIASEGMHVFIYSIANFPTFRCAEFLRNDIDYHKLSVTVVAVGAGLSYGNLGYSHHAIQDYGLIRMMPNFVINAPGDNYELKSCLKYLFKNPQPSYLRLDKNIDTNYNKIIPNLKLGHWNEINKQKYKKQKTFITTGNTLALAQTLIKKKEWSDFSIYSLPIWGLKAKKNQINYLKKFNKIISIEDHLFDNGFGSWLLESATKSERSKIENIALSSRVVGKVGTQSYLNKFFKHFK